MGGKRTLILFVFVAAVVLLGIGRVAHAATIYVAPSSGSHSVGSTFSVTVFVSSTDQAMNAASGVISFPADKLEVTSLSKSGSIFSLWVQEPSFSNTAGTINFEGIVLNPGFTGSNGAILTASFRVKAAGNATLSFADGSVLANDGTGTNILTGLGSATFSLGDAGPGIPEAEVPTQAAGTPAAPQISSLTHADPNRWYAASEAVFTWPVPDDVTAARLLIGRIPNATPTVLYTPAVDTKEITDLEDGTWYFHVQLRNDIGWGAVSHFRLQIDTEDPTRLDVVEIEREDKTDPRVSFTLEAEDETSEIDHYRFQIDDGAARVWRDDGSGIFRTSALDPGVHALTATAVDNAGNTLTRSVEFEIEALATPTITKHPAQLSSDEPLVIQGVTQYPNARTMIWFEKDGEDALRHTVKNNPDGTFTAVADETLDGGTYSVWAQVIDERGAKSHPSEAVTIVLEEPALFHIGSFGVTTMRFLMFVILVLAALLVYGWYRFNRLRRVLRKEIRDIDTAVHDSFDALKDDVYEELRSLESKKKLTKEEERVRRHLRRKLKTAEKTVREKVREIKDEIT